MDGQEALLADDAVHRRKQYDMECAAFVFEDAMVGHFSLRYPHGPRSAELRSVKNFAEKLQKGEQRIILIAMLLVETPPWCDNPRWDPSAWCHSTCRLKNGIVIETFGHHFLSPEIGFSVEVVCMLVATKFLVYEVRVDKLMQICEGYHKGEYKHPPQTFLAVLLVMWLDLCVSICFGINFRLSHLLRIALLFHWPRTRVGEEVKRSLAPEKMSEIPFGTCPVFQSAVSALNDLASIAIIWVSTVILFAWLILVIVKDLKDVDALMPADPATAGFNDFGSALMSLFGLATGSQFPDAMNPLVGKLPWSCPSPWHPRVHCAQTSRGMSSDQQVHHCLYAIRRLDHTPLHAADASRRLHCLRNGRQEAA